jgi:hypothetical protein
VVIPENVITRREPPRVVVSKEVESA